MKLSQTKSKSYYQRKLIELERTKNDLAVKIDRAYDRVDISTSMALEAKYAAVIEAIANLRQQITNISQPALV